ncbi:MAG: hypothetical protein ACLFSL_05085 [Candidatus Woesearchaeota archaeon]
MEVIISILFLLMFFAVFFLFLTGLIGVLNHLFFERKSYPEFQAPARFREKAFLSYVREVEQGNFEHQYNAEAIAFFSLKKRRRLKDAMKLGSEKRFDSEMSKLLDNKYKSHLDQRVCDMARKDPEKMKRFKSALSERRRKEDFYWDSAWDAFLWDHTTES